MKTIRNRPVTIELTPEGRAYLVRYPVRNPGTRHLAAQFDARHNTLAHVVAWVEANPKLHLSPIYGTTTLPAKP